MRLHNRAADRQPHAHAVLFRCEESFEHRIRIFQSHPGILYLHQDSIATLPFGTNEEPLVICHGIHRFDAIQEQVEYQLLQLYAISDYRRQVLSQGGVDAADFAEMLMRMYLRWAERHGYPVVVLDTSYAEEAGLKSATFEVKVPYAFGNLSVEAGTHRLVRISPFDNQGRRQTSFAAVEVIPLIEPTDTIEIPDNDIKVDVFRSSGPGGQSVNTTDSAVRMTHLPTGIVVSMQNEKSQIQNRAAALRVLKSRLLLQRQAEEHAQKKAMAGDVKASWGDQMRSYVLNPYQMVKDLRTEYEVGNTSGVFDGDIDGFIEAGIRWKRSAERDEA